MEQKTQGIVTALKSGNCFHMVIPKQIVEALGIEDRHRLKIEIEKMVDPITGFAIRKEPRHKNLRDNLNENNS